MIHVFFFRSHGAVSFFSFLVFPFEEGFSLAPYLREIEAT